MKPADFGRLLTSSDARGVIPNRELAPFARIIQQRDDRWRFLDRSPPRDGATYRALRTGLEPSMPYEDGLAARSHEPACTLSDAIACMLFYAKLSLARLF